jgi:hypothetical protein
MALESTAYKAESLPDLSQHWWSLCHKHFKIPCHSVTQLLLHPTVALGGTCEAHLMLAAACTLPSWTFARTRIDILLIYFSVNGGNEMCSGWAGTVVNGKTKLF